jgi:hypothetical protein
VATFTQAFVDCSPGNVVTLTGSGLTGASVTLGNQGADVPGAIAINAAVASGGASLTFTVPDGATTGPLVAAVGGDSQVATCELVVSAQYLQAAQYHADAEGTGDATSALSPGRLDELLRDASSMVDSLIGTTLRLLQVSEEHAYRRPRNGHYARVWPLRGPLRSMPIVSVESLTGIGSGYASTQTFTPAFRRLNSTEGYIDVGAWYGLTFTPESWRIVYTAGYGWKETPRAVRKATAIIATELMIQAGIIDRGFGGLSRVREGDVQYDRRNEPFDLPPPVAKLLTPWRGGGIR